MRLWIWQCLESKSSEAACSYTISGEFAVSSQADVVKTLVDGGVRHSDAIRFVNLYLDIENRTRTLYCDYISEVREAVEFAKDPEGRRARLQALSDTFRDRFEALNRSVEAAVSARIRHIRLATG